MASDTTQKVGWLDRFLAFAPGGKARRADAEVVFPPNFLASLDRLRLAALRAMGGGLREGHRLGAYKGGQLEFHGHRSYSPGDELRYVDWNSYARLGKPYVKEFAREEAGVLHLLLDATASMSLGAPAKWTFARRVAALFSHVALESKDLVSLHVFRSSGVVEHFPRKGAKCGTPECLAFLERQQTEPPAPENAAASPLSAAVSNLLKINPHRGRVILISDFWQAEQDIVTAVARLCGAGFDVSAIHVLAPEELQPDASGDLLARSVEETGTVELSAGSDLNERYARELEAHRRAVEDVFRKRGGSYLQERCDTSIERVLISTLRQRRWVT